MVPQSTAERFPALPEDCTRAPDAAERVILERWRAEGTFAAVQAARRDAEPFVFWEGPPTANGRPGIHHMLGRSLKDSVCRYQSMAGKRVERKAGWDTHGLPVELEVEKALGISGKPEIEEYGVAEFNAKCRESVWKYRGEWEEISQRIGYWLDYDHPYVTYDSSYVDSVWYLLARFHREGLVYRGKRVLPYCGRCGTGLSSHELGQPGVYRDVKDPSVTLRFKLKQSLLSEGLSAWKAEHYPEAPESMLAWTTTPWTLPSNFALAVNPTVTYAALHIHRDEPKATEPADEIVWMAEDLIATLHPLGIKREEDAKEGDSFYVVKHTRPGSELVGARYEPLFDKLPPFAEPGAWEPDETAIHQVLAGDFVTVEDGTGIVHQAP